jgi:hypothetical protein
MGDQVVEVACYSGASYAERPEAVIWRGQRLSIARILKDQITPTGKSFNVILDNGWSIRLQYLNQQTQWIAFGFPD